MNQIIQKLRDVRGTIRRYFLLHGLAATLLILLGFLTGAFIIDFGIYQLNGDLPAQVRLGILAIGGCIVAWGVFRFIMYPMSKKITDDDIAIRVEDHYPQLNDQLISALQLSRHMEGDALHGSRDLIEHTVTDAVERVQSYDFSSIVKFQPVSRLWGRFAMAAIILLGLAFWRQAEAAIFFNRLVGGNMEWPKQTELVYHDLKTTVAKGDPFQLSIVAHRGDPYRVYLHYKIKGEKRWQEQVLDKTTITIEGKEHPLFYWDLDRINFPMTIWAEGGDDTTEEISIEVLPPPAIANIDQFIDYPDYITNLVDTPEDRPEAGGNIKVPSGSNVKLHIETTEPIQSGNILVSIPGEEDQNFPMQLGATVEGEKGSSEATVEFPITKTGQYYVSLLGSNGLPNKEPYRYAIRATEDRAPIIKVLEPGDDRSATPNANYPLRLDVSDDYGIKEIRLVYQVETRPGTGEQRIAFSEAQLSGGGYGSTPLRANMTFSFSDLGLQVKDRVRYYFESEDYCNINGEPNIGKTKDYYFTVVDQGELEDLVQEEINRIRDEIKRILVMQKTLNSRTLTLQQNLESASDMSRGLKTTASDTAIKQRHVTQRLETVLRRFGNQLDVVRYNNLFTESQREKLNNARAQMRLAGEDFSPEAAFQLREASSATQSERWNLAMRATVKAQGDTTTALERALSYLEDYIDFQQIVKEVRRIKETQERIKQLIRERAKNSND